MQHPASWLNNAVMEWPPVLRPTRRWVESDRHVLTSSGFCADLRTDWGVGSNDKNCAAGLENLTLSGPLDVLPIAER
jgi:hypothetical protein